MFQTIVKMFILVGLIIISAGRRKNCRFSYPDKIDLLFSSLQIVVKLSNLKLKNRLHLCSVRSQWIQAIGIYLEDKAWCYTSSEVGLIASIFPKVCIYLMLISHVSFYPFSIQEHCSCHHC